VDLLDFLAAAFLFLVRAAFFADALRWAFVLVAMKNTLYTSYCISSVEKITPIIHVIFIKIWMITLGITSFDDYLHLLFHEKNNIDLFFR
jgi:hypothetical protein